MKMLYYVGLLLAGPFALTQNLVAAQSSVSNSSIELISQIPTCAMSCLTTNVVKTTCALTDLPCLCANQTFQDIMADCVRKDCILSKAIFLKNITEMACGSPIRDRSGAYSGMSFGTGSLGIVLIIIRLVFKKFFSRNGRLGNDDAVIAFAVLVGIPGMIINKIGLVSHGIGKDVWTLDPADLPNFAMYFYIMEVIYVTEIALIKLSLSLFYLYVFPGTTVRRLLMGTAAFNAIFGIVFVIAAIFQCRPLSFYWTQYQDYPPAGKCVDLNRFAWANAAIGLAVDLWMIALPISQIRKLQLHWKKKIGVCFMFLIGTFATVISLLRLKSVIYFAKLIDPTWDQWDVAFWSTMEVNIGITCTCLPTMRLICVRLFPKFMSTDTSRNHPISSRNTDKTVRGSATHGPPPPYSRDNSLELLSNSPVLENNDAHFSKTSEKPTESV